MSNWLFNLHNGLSLDLLRVFEGGYEWQLLHAMSGRFLESRCKRIPCTHLWNVFHSVFPMCRVGRTLVSERILCLLKKQIMKVKAVGSSSKGRFSSCSCHLRPTTKLPNLIMPQFPHVYKGEEITVLANYDVRSK